MLKKKQEKIDITTENFKKILGRIPNWKSPCPDLVQGFWCKNFGSLHETVRLQLKECLDNGFARSWWTRGRTSLLQKDNKKSRNKNLAMAGIDYKKSYDMVHIRGLGNVYEFGSVVWKSRK